MGHYILFVIFLTSLMKNLFNVIFFAFGMESEMENKTA